MMATRSLRIAILAGEPSGDRLAARVMSALKEQWSEEIEFYGVGGVTMIEEGLASEYPLEDFAVMGLLEVLPHALSIHRKMRDLSRKIDAWKPDLLLTVDAPNFSLPIAKSLQGKGIKLVHLVAPSVWAWKAKRAKKVSRYLDKLLTLLPFEPPYFTEHGLEAVFVGHPATEGWGQDGARDTARRALDLKDDQHLLCLLPGSRRGELARLLNPFLQASLVLQQKEPSLRICLPSLEHLEKELRPVLQREAPQVELLLGEDKKRLAFEAADIALAASGTVVVELAAAMVPTIVGYRVNPITAALAPLLLNIKAVSLPNILLDRPVIPEYLQDRCQPEAIADALMALVEEPERAAQQRREMHRFRDLIAGPGKSPSQEAAKEILKMVS